MSSRPTLASAVIRIILVGAHLRSGCERKRELDDGGIEIELNVIKKEF